MQESVPLEPVLGRVRRSGWNRLARGLYLPAEGRTPIEDLRGWQLALPSTAAFTHLTAARIRGWWEPATIRQPVFVTIPDPVPRPRRPGLLVSRHCEPPVIEHRRGLRITPAAETLLEAARDLDVLDLVVMGDCALRMRHVTLSELRRAAARRRRGAPLLRRVIPLLDDRSESPWESIMRVLHLAAEIPVTPQYKIYDDRGCFVARADLRIDGTRRLQEYDGADHRTAEVHRSDLSRARSLLRAGWERSGFSKVDLLDGGAGVIADVDRLLGRTSEQRRLDAWNHLVIESLHGRRGRTRALKRWFGKPARNRSRTTRTDPTSLSQTTSWSAQTGPS